MKRVLHIPGIMTEGGVETVIMNWYRHIDRDNIQFDFCVSRNCPAPIDEEIQALGGRVIYSCTIQEKKFGYLNNIASIIKQYGPYDTVHIHSAHMGAFSVLACKLAKIHNIVYHAHSSRNLALKGIWGRRLIEIACGMVIRRFSTVKLACSIPAGKFVYSNNDFQLIKNAIDLCYFRPYSESEITSQKAKLGLRKGDIVVGYVARFVPGKNHQLLINLISEDKKNNGNLVLLLVGDGPLKVEMETLAISLKCYDRVLFAGKQKDMPVFYNMMDVFCLPSEFEGLGMVAIEAQACGIPCIISSGVPTEVNMDVVPVRQMEEGSSVTEWINCIYGMAGHKSNDANMIFDGITRKGYNLSLQVKEIENIYQIV